MRARRVGRAQSIGRLLLASALRANPRGAVLFSSGDPARIRANAALAEPGAVETDELERFERLAAGHA